MSPLAAFIMGANIMWTGRVTVYAPHLRQHELGAELRAEQLAEQARDAAELAGVRLPLFVALLDDESHFNHAALSDEEAFGATQLLPTSRWGRACIADTRAAARVGIDAAEQLNMQWGALALRDALDACDGDAVRAIGFYRTGRCVDGPRARATAERAFWVEALLNEPMCTPGEQ